MSGSFPKSFRKAIGVVVSGWLTILAGNATFAQGANDGGTNAVKVKEVQGEVEILHAQTTQWVTAREGQVLHPADELRTGANSRAALLWSDQSVVPVGASTEIEIVSPGSQQQQCGLHLVRGIISFFHRDKPGQIQIITRGAMAGVEGTEFVLAVDGADETSLSVIDGRVRLANSSGSLVLTNGQQAVVAPGKPPVRAAGFIANNLLQWCFYYPAILDLNELPLSAQESQALASSMAAYRDGDLPRALTLLSAASKAQSDAATIYNAALLLSAGNVEEAEKALASLNGKDERIQRLAAALRELIAAVKHQRAPGEPEPQLATELLARSYYDQSRAAPGALERALYAAKKATDVDPTFSFAWERVAELEFSFGQVDRASKALETSLALAPANAEALSLKGFLLAAQNRAALAIVWFDRALAVDSSLGNAWLGRGLCRIRLRDNAGGREDLLVAAAIEPQRAELRSYLGKAYANGYQFHRAGQEFERAKQLDPNDPTAWLYSALMNQQRNRINDAIRDLEKSEELNENRSVYRSQLLLDQDEAVRSASLATMYQDDGMFDVSVNEASRAVNYDYGNYSGHLFLADSYEQLRDANEINLRYETPAESEYLVANLLAPAVAGTLSPTISQGEYSRLFQQDGPGVISDSEYLSRGAWTESGAFLGAYDDFSYDFEAYYRTDPGQWINNNVEQRQLSLTLKQQLTRADTVYFNINQYQADYGDLLQYYNPNTQANPEVQYQEKQNPNVSIGFNHEWAPGVHTLFYGARLNDTASFTNGMAPTFLATSAPGLGLVSMEGVTMDQNFMNRMNIYSGELQQIFEKPAHTTIVGGRVQYGDFRTSNLQLAPPINSVFPPTAADQNVNSILNNLSIYGYHQWQILDSLQLIGGIDYDYLRSPDVFFTAPISGNENVEQQFSPKAGFVFTPWDGTTVRFAYTRSLAGTSIDQSYQIEPSQVAGFIQNYRAVIPESIVGATPGARFSTYDLSLEQKFRTGTYLTISGEILDSKDELMNGSFAYDAFTTPSPVPSSLNEDLRYQEETFQFTANQLVERDWSFGLKYRLSHAVLNENFPGVPNSLLLPFQNFRPQQQTKGTLNQLDLTAIYNHPSGFFVEGEALWFGQNNSGYTPAEPGDEFWQFNVFAGFRSPGRNVELAIGLLNIGDQGYNLNPLNIYNELPLTRTLAGKLQINF